MKIEEFWNLAFVHALSRLPAAKAKAEADKATKLCIEHWQSQRKNWARQAYPRWQDQDVANVIMTVADLKNEASARALAVPRPKRRKDPARAHS